MKVGKILPSISSKISKAYQKNGSVVNKMGNFLDPNGKTVSTGVLTALMSTCVVIPRFLKARDNTERREVLTRDIPTVATVLFAMKAMNGAIAKSAEKKMGMILTNGPKNYKELPLGKKLLNLFKPNSGVTVFTTEQILEKYTNVNNADTLSKMLKYVEENGGDVEKVLTIDKTKGGALSKITEKIFKGTLADKTTDEIVRAIKDPVNADSVKEMIGILDNAKANPIVKSCKTVTSITKTASLAVIALFIGFGLPKLNQFITESKNKKDGKQNESVMNKSLTEKEVGIFKKLNKTV